MKASLPSNEAQRLEALRQYDVLDTPPEQSFDDLALLAAHICQMPMAQISLIAEDRQWFKSKIGVSVRETSRDIAFCAHTILHKDEVMEVRDAQVDSRFADNPLVTADPHIRYYAGAPLVTPGGHALGAICVMDRTPRKLSDEQLAALRALSRQVITELELRRQARALENEIDERQRAETLLQQQFSQLSASKAETERLLALAQKSRRALLSVLEDEKRAGQSLRESEEKFRQIAENINEIFWITDSKWHEIFYVSPAYEKIWGRTCKSLYDSPRQWLETIHPEDRERISKAVADFSTTGTYDVEYRIVRPDQRVYWIHDRGFPVRNATGEIYRIAGTAENITGRKRADRRLSTQGAISRVLAESNTLNEATPKIMQAICEFEEWDFGAIWEVNKKSNTLRCLDAWYRPELPAEELAGRTRELNFASNIGLPGRVWASGKPLLIRDIADDPNYSRAPFAMKIGLRSALAFPIMLEGEVIGVMDFLGREIHEVDEKTLEIFTIVGRQIGSFFKRKQLEEQFRQSQKLESVGQLAGGVAHDFNNILAVIQMQSDLLKGGGNLSPEQMEIAGEIGAATRRAAELTRQLLVFSRKERLQLRDLNLNEAINNMTKMLRRTLGENIEMQFKFAMELLFIHADAGMMDQVLMNLAVNARDAMPEGGKLVIETSAVEFDESAAAHSTQVRPGSFVSLSVSDTGCGIPPEILPKIFEPFFTTKDVGKGTGLGLATVFGIIQQHKGWINVYSEINRGTTIRIYLPRLAKVSDQQFVTPITEPSRGGNETILLVEDEPRLRGSVRNVLLSLGYQVLEASNGAGALEVWKQNRDKIHLLLTDMVMPGGMSGHDLGERLLKENPNLKVIYVSGYSAEIAGKDLPLEEGYNFLSKPFQAQKLAQTVRKRLDDKVKS